MKKKILFKFTFFVFDNIGVVFYKNQQRNVAAHQK